jgi:hypothetical protein
MQLTLNYIFITLFVKTKGALRVDLLTLLAAHQHGQVLQLHALLLNLHLRRDIL